MVLEPDTLADVPHASHIKFAYTDEGLYIGADFEQPKDTLIKRLSGQDVYAGLNRDSINLTLDTSGRTLRILVWDQPWRFADGRHRAARVPFSNEWDGPGAAHRLRQTLAGLPNFSFLGALSPCPVAETSATWACTCPAR